MYHIVALSDTQKKTRQLLSTVNLLNSSHKKEKEQDA